MSRSEYISPVHVVKGFIFLIFISASQGGRRKNTYRNCERTVHEGNELSYTRNRRNEGKEKCIGCKSKVLSVIFLFGVCGHPGLINHFVE